MKTFVRAVLCAATVAVLTPVALAAPPLLEPADVPLSEVGFADFNNDGRTDMAVRVFATGDVRVSYNIGDRFSATPDWIGYASSAPDGVNWDTLFADIDGDGHADSVDRNRSDGNLCVHRNLGTSFATTGACVVFPFSRPSPRWRAFLAPIDGDARADLVSVDQQTGTVYVHRNTSTASVPAFDTTPLLTQTIAVPSYPAGPWQQFFADCSGDGKADLIELDQTDRYFYCHAYNTPSNPGVFAPVTGVIFPAPPEVYEKEFAFGQFDAGGIADIVSHDLRSGDIAVLPVLPFGGTLYTGHRALLRDRSPTYTRSAAQQPLPADPTRSIAALTWYDDDHNGPNSHRPDPNGWFALYPGFPNAVEPGHPGPFRSDTSLLGTYASGDTGTIRQHAYWLRAAGIDVAVADISNCLRATNPDAKEPTIEWYCNEIRNVLTKWLNVTAGIRDFVPPRMVIAMRIPQDPITHAELYTEATAIADDLYAIYLTNPGAWYRYNDGSANKDKPLLLVFAKFDAPWLVAPQWSDSRFNIRYTNGHFEYFGFTTPETATSSYIAGDLPYWTFLENLPDTTRPLGYYRDVYRRMPTDTTQSEQSTAWTSVYIAGTDWDGQQEVHDGKITIDRTVELLYAKPPRNALIQRFNYQVAWPASPVEGLSVDESSYFEPSRHIGWTIYDKVSNAVYNLKKQRKRAPGKPVVTYRYAAGARIVFESANYPTQYCTSTTPTCPENGWIYLDMKTACPRQKTQVEAGEGGAPLTGDIYLRTRNPFGDSDAVFVTGTFGLLPSTCSHIE